MKTLLKTVLVAIAFISFSCNAKTKSTPKKDVIVVHTSEKKSPKSTVKVALLLDTSNSMDGLIDQAKAQLWEIINELSYAKCDNESPALKIALYEYGNDRLESSDNYIRQVLDFSDDLDEISKKLFSLTTNGGSEYCGAVIQTSLNELNWGANKQDLKLIFIAGNEPFTQGKVKYKDATTNAVEKDVTVNTIFCGNYENGIGGKWQDGALLAGGDYMTIDHNKAIVHIKTPYDEIIIKLNSKLNKTYVSYGAQGYLKSQNQSVQDTNAESLAEEVIVKRTISKSSKAYKNTTWDLVDAEKEDDFQYDKVDKKTLPTELQNKSTEELKAYVKGKSKEREEIQKEIQEVNKKRTAYIVQKKKETNSEAETLDSAMIKALKKQAESKNYSWE
ncbi:MAG: VWA domain-containing protein [Urechidicola sp.]|nr:VWA domain-containing protein [Urechidicola sp.]